MKNYIIGLDIGTESVGWAVVEEDNQKIMKRGNKSLWGVRLFDEANSCESRRSFRSTRRRYNRRRERIRLLQEEFKEEINKVDEQFFNKLKTSKISPKDTNNKKVKLTDYDKKEIFSNAIRGLVTNDNGKTIVLDNKYPTIYHLRKRLVEDSSRADIRLVYLAIHHIIKYRGNFLYGNTNFNIETLDLKSKLSDFFNECIEQVPELNIPDDFNELINLEKIENILLTKTKNDIKVELKSELKILDVKDFNSELIKALIGYKFSVNKMFNIEEEKLNISFNGDDYDKNIENIEKLLGDKISIINILKELYDMIFLKKLFEGSESNSISSLMVERFNEHKKDLALLKEIFKIDPSIYKELFKNKKDKKCIYELYITNNKINKENSNGIKNDFYKKIEKELEKIRKQVTDDKLLQKIDLIKEKIDTDKLLPKITDIENGKYPYQLNKDELVKIIENQGKHYDFLLNTLEDGTYRIVKLLEFRIPYYVGPLVHSRRSKNAWMERNIGEENKKITPFNFDEIINKDKTAENFIKRMISRCTYLLNEYALPNNSILYSEFKVLNELKQIKVNNSRLTEDQIIEIYHELFCQTSGNITEKKFIKYLIEKNWYPMYDNELKITGYSSEKRFANNMQPYVDFFGENGIFENTDYKLNDAETIIEWVTIFEDKDILEKKLITTFGDLSEDKIKLILHKNYSGWGSLSKTLLKDLTYTNKCDNTEKSIMDLMYETNENFMQIINNDEYKFQDKIKKYNGETTKKDLSYDAVKDLATSPATKKGIYQALKIVKEIVSYIGYEPKYISIEMSREDGKKERIPDRKGLLTNKYIENKIKISEYSNYSKLSSELSIQDKIDDKMYLYFIQEGKCLYCGKPLDIHDLSDCEIDHIIPRTLVKDNSTDNKALVHRSHNQVKKDSFIIPKEFRNVYTSKYWDHLKSVGLMGAKKYYNLNRREFNEEDIQGFINRQLVETRQITKHVANILSNYYKDTKVIYLKSALSSDYRKKFELYKYRSLNDYHHAHDAYLAAVLGEYKEKYLKFNVDFDLIKELNNRLRESNKYNELKYGFVINSLDNLAYDIINDLSDAYIDENTGEVLFNSEDFNKRVENTLYRNDIFVTRKTEIKTGEFYNQTIYGAGVGQIPLKENMPVEIYGGYKSIKNAYLTLVEYKEKKKVKRKLIGIPIDISIASKNDNNILSDYIKNYMEIDNFIILKDNIPFETEIIYNNQNVTISGYGNSKKMCELTNAYELKISKIMLQKWKYTLNKIFNNKEILTIDNVPVITEETFREQLIEIINYLYNKSLEYPIYSNAIEDVKNAIDINELTNDEIIKVIKELCKLFKCNGDKLELPEYGFPKTKEVGRLRKNITSGVIIYKSVTGIKEYRYEF